MDISLRSDSDLLTIDLPKTSQVIQAFIHTTLENLNRDGAAIGLSGGLDSAVAATLTVRVLGSRRVHLINMPEQDSKTIHRKHARRLAKFLGSELIVHNMSPILRAAGTYRILPLRFIPGKKMRAAIVAFAKSRLRLDEENLLASRLKPTAGTLVAKGGAYAVTKHRMRMVKLYQYAEIHNLMVVGAANRTEWLTGTFSKWGVDHCADIMPLLHLYRSQLERLAEYLEIPEYILHKPADPDVMPGVNNKGALLGDFRTADKILVGIEKQRNIEDLYQIYGKKEVEQLKTLWELSKHMREAPYHLSKD
jgi:NAD+ synthase